MERPDQGMRPGPASLLLPPVLGAINHLLLGQPWLRQRLLPFAGRVALLRVFPMELRTCVSPEGGLLPAADQATSDVVVHIPVSAMVRLAAGDERARSKVELTGDPAFAAVLGAVLRELRWDAEEDLSVVVGDVAARRIVRAGQSLLAWQRQAARNLFQSVADYLAEEQAMLAQRSEVERWMREIDDVRDAVERLEKRIQRLDSSRSG